MLDTLPLMANGFKNQRREMNLNHRSKYVETGKNLRMVAQSYI
jgi:hypothetical protein